MVYDKQINLNTAADAALCPFTAGTFRVEEFVQKHDLQTGYTRTYGFSRHTLFRLVCMRVRFGPLLTYKSIKGKEMDSPLQKWLLTVLKRMLGVRDTTPSWCVMRECGLEPLQFNWFCAAMRLYNSLTKSNSYTMKKVLHADMQLITWSNDC